MPVRVRREKRRVSPEAELEAWGVVFESGCDFFNVPDLAGLGDPFCSAPARRLAGQAWRRLGAEYLRRRGADGKAPWALDEFGRP